MAAATTNENPTEEVEPLYDWDGTLIPNHSGTAAEYFEHLDSLTPEDLSETARGLAGKKLDLATARPALFHEHIRATAKRLGIELGDIHYAGHDKTETVRSLGRRLIDNNEDVVRKIHTNLGPEHATLVSTHERIMPKVAEIKHDPADAYGACPECGGKCASRERRINGDDTCENGHTYPSKTAVKSAAINDKVLAPFGVENDGEGGFRSMKWEQRKHECPECKQANAYYRTAHEDTAMECREEHCPDCGFFKESSIKSATVAAAPPLTGPAALAAALERLDIGKLKQEQMDILKQRKISKRPRAVQVLNIIEGLERNNSHPRQFLSRNVPVIPPAFRPFSLVGTTFIPGDANELYRDLMDLRTAYDEESKTFGPEGAGNARLNLYDAMKAVYGFGEPVKPKTKQRGVSGFLQKITGSNPKFSFVQRKLLGKPQDNVSRGTIAVDPELSLDEIGMPIEQAWVSYKEYVQKRLIQSGMSPAEALRHIRDRSDYARKALETEVTKRPVIYSRAPSWHKFNVVAGRPKLIEGNTITINPLVTTGLNADFDGDAIHLHVPATDGAVSEAWEKLMPSKMLFSIRDPEKVVPQPKHELILGLYTANRRAAKQQFRFPDEKSALDAIKLGKVTLSDDIEIGEPPPVPEPAPVVPMK